MFGWWLACLLGTGIAIYLLWGKRTTALAWPEAALVGLGLIVSAGPMINEFEFSSTGLKLKTNVQAAADAAKVSGEIATQNAKRIADLEKNLADLSASVAAVKPVLADQAARERLEATTKAIASQAPLTKAAQDLTRDSQRDLDKILQTHPKLFKKIF
jgi:hypothetical protein